jgi:tetratricopeptide (TPR) repeat protein
MIKWLRPLLLLFYAPARGMAEVRDRAPLGRAALLALLALVGYLVYMLSGAFGGTESVPGVLLGFVTLIFSATVLLPLALVFVPLVVFFANIFERGGSFGLVLRREFAATAATVFYAWAAACLLAVLTAALLRVTGLEAEAYRTGLEAGRIAEAQEPPTPQALGLMLKFLAHLGLMFAAPLGFFLLWAAVGARQVFRMSWVLSALAVVLAGILSLPAAYLLVVILGPVISSPLLLLLLFFVLRGYLAEALRARQARAAFRQNLEAATLNPADATAHYHLGLTHVERRELAEARSRFARAIEIDPEETDAHYQLGLLARAEGRHADAIQHFGEVVSRDEAHAQHEVWREVGATYLAAGQYGDARDALERFLARRPSDPEGLYLMGRAHSGLGRAGEAREWMQRCIEAVRTAPAYKHRADRRWLDEAQQFLRTQA